MENLKDMKTWYRRGYHTVVISPDYAQVTLADIKNNDEVEFFPTFAEVISFIVWTYAVEYNLRVVEMEDNMTEHALYKQAMEWINITKMR